jgi:deoxyribodipyrimidine photo-lyase
MSTYLKWGELHPRTLLADLDRSKAATAYRRELAWREFYADVQWHEPESARRDLRPEFANLEYDDPDERFEAWKQGRTGFPVVDAGMREMLATGRMHNRVRMVVASFLVKDLHVWWRHGARHFMEWLADGDLASNQQNWQWVAGSGTDPAPFFRVFNPTTQGRKFDADGDYVRRWVPELADLAADSIHEPQDVPGYPAPIVDHAAERKEALARYERINPRRPAGP